MGGLRPDLLEAPVLLPAVMVQRDWPDEPGSDRNRIPASSSDADRLLARTVRPEGLSQDRLRRGTGAVRRLAAAVGVGGDDGPSIQDHQLLGD